MIQTFGLAAHRYHARAMSKEPPIQPPRHPAESRVPPPPMRDQRLDFYRGVLQVFIFVGHVPDNPLAWLIHRSWGFSDSSELFVLFSGLTLGSLGARVAAKSGWWRAAGDLWRRAFRLYLRHLIVFVLMAGYVFALGWISGDSYWPVGVGLDALADRPWPAVPAALLLAYQPVFSDILPLFVVLMLSLPLFLATPRRWGFWVLVGPGAQWLAVQIWGIALPSWPAGAPWTFNPFAWMVLFWLGAVLGRAGLWRESVLPAPGTGAGRLLLAGAAGLLLAGAVIKPSWLLAGAGWPVPALLDETLWPLDKTNLGWLPLLHALALAWLVGTLTQAAAPWYGQGLAAEIARCGRFSLDVFCLGLFLSLGVHFILRGVAMGGLGGLLVAALSQITAIGLMILYARALEARITRRMAGR